MQARVVGLAARVSDVEASRSTTAVLMSQSDAILRVIEAEVATLKQQQTRATE